VVPSQGGGGIYWVTEELSAFQERLCTLNLVTSCFCLYVVVFKTLLNVIGIGWFLILSSKYKDFVLLVRNTWFPPAVFEGRLYKIEREKYRIWGAHLFIKRIKFQYNSVLMVATFLQKLPKPLPFSLSA
jgi:hypothetical protein